MNRNASSPEFYFDDPEIGPSKETSHPNFVDSFSDEFYYDNLDELAPFGNDEGAELLYSLEDWYKDDERTGSIIDWLVEQIDQAGYDYSNEEILEMIEEGKITELLQGDPDFVQFVNNIIIAATLGQIKITGQLEEPLEKAFYRAVKIQKDYFKDEGGYLTHLQRMEKDLKQMTF